MGELYKYIIPMNELDRPLLNLTNVCKCCPVCSLMENFTSPIEFSEACGNEPFVQKIQDNFKLYALEYVKMYSNYENNLSCKLHDVLMA